MKVVQLFTREDRNSARVRRDERRAPGRLDPVDPLRRGALLGGRARGRPHRRGHHRAGRRAGGGHALRLHRLHAALLHAAARSVREVLGDAVLDGQQRADLRAARHASRRSPIAGPRLPAARPGGAVAFEHVWFAYQGERLGARDLSFRVEAGEKVAFVGATGAGKTTIIKLLTRLYEVTSGRVSVDGVDLRDLPQERLRRRIAMVLQDVFLFSGTIADNIALGRPDVGPRDRRARGPGRRRRTASSRPCPRATTPRSASAARTSRPASASCSPSPAPWPTARTSSCSTRRPARSTARPRR